MPFKFSTAKGRLTEPEMARIICIFLSMDQSAVMQNTDWELAKAQMGSASVESLKKGLTNTLKKLDKVTNVTELNLEDPTPIERTPKKKTPSKKRKTTSGGSDGGAGTENTADGDDDEGGSAKKKVKTEDDDDEFV